MSTECDYPLGDKPKDQIPDEWAVSQVRTPHILRIRTSSCLSEGVAKQAGMGLRSSWAAHCLMRWESVLTVSLRVPLPPLLVHTGAVVGGLLAQQRHHHLLLRSSQLPGACGAA